MPIAVGAAATCIALAVILFAKFTEGAWIILVAVPLTVVVLKSVRSYYDAIDQELRETGPITLEDVEPPTVLVVAQQWNRLSERVVTFALTISPDVVAVHLSKLEGPENEDSEQLLRHQWRVDRRARTCQGTQPAPAHVHPRALPEVARAVAAAH